MGEAEVERWEARATPGACGFSTLGTELVLGTEGRGREGPVPEKCEGVLGVR